LEINLKNFQIILERKVGFSKTNISQVSSLIKERQGKT
jgi:hypothetical protein